MTMHSVYFKEHEGIIQNPTGSLSLGSGAGPWWSGLVTQSGFDESVGQVKPSSMNHHSIGDQLTLTVTEQGGRGTDQGLAKGQFTVFPGDRKSSGNGQKPLQLHAAFSMQSAPSEYRGRLELGFGQPVICGKYPSGDQCYGIFSTFGPQITGRIMLPLNLTTDDCPIFVNAKQYHGIIRRRRSRAKAEMTNKVLKDDRKPYLHLSRHLHAKRRPRGCGGRFLNTKKMDCSKGGADSKKTGEGLFSQPTESQNSEVLQSDNSNQTSRRETNSRSCILGSEVMSMFSMGDLNHFPISDLRSSVVSMSEMMLSKNSTGQGFVLPSKWTAAAIPEDRDSRCSFKV